MDGRKKLAWVSVYFDNGVHFSARISVWIAYGRNRRDIVIVVLDSTGMGLLALFYVLDQEVLIRFS